MKTVINDGAGIRTVVALQDGALVTGTVQDCVPIREDALARHNSGAHGSKEMWHAARLPRVAVEQYCNAQGITFGEWMRDPKHVKAMCNDPDLRDFRIHPGRI